MNRSRVDGSATKRALSLHSWFCRRLLEVGGHLGQGSRDSLNCSCIDTVKEATSNASEMNGPRGFQFGHTTRSKPRDVAAGVIRARLLAHETTRLEVVYQSGHPTSRQVGCARKIGHPQCAIGTLGKVHHRRVLARRQAGASYQVGVQIPWENFYNSHHCAPERFLVRGERLDRRHCFQDNLLYQAILNGRDLPRPPRPLDLSTAIRPDELRTRGAAHDEREPPAERCDERSWRR
jgi:hypothetical protein